MNVVFLGIGVFAIGTIVFALMLLLRGDGSREQKLMQYFLMGALIQNAAYLLELSAPTMEAAIVSAKIQYIGSLTIPISYCYFMFSYCYEKTPRKLLAVMQIVDVFILGLVFTCDAHHFYYRDVQWLENAQGHGYLKLDYGPGYWLFVLCGTVVPYILSQYALVRACIERPEYAADRKCRLILMLSVLPVCTMGAYSMKLTPAYDLTPAVLGLVLASVVILIWSQKVYDFSSLAFGILLNSMSNGVIALDEQRQITNYNPAAAEIFTDLNGLMTGKTIGTLRGFPADIQGGETKKEFCLNDRFYQGHEEPILDAFGKNKGYVVLIYDVTETRNYIEEIKSVREQAEQANIAKSAFLANMSHEIRTPMNAIVGLSDIIMEESRGQKVYEYACDVKSASQNLLGLINDILDLSKVEAGKMELVVEQYHVKSLTTDVLNMMDVVASRRGLNLKRSYDLSIPCGYLGDEGRIKQILINILNNAMKFTKEGYVAFSVGGRPGETADMELLTFRIEDTGCGIHEADLKAIFDNFKQVDSRRNRTVEGTGLGLSITKRLIDLMGGTIQVESVYGEGTTFTVEIPQRIADGRPLSEMPEAQGRKEEAFVPFCAEDCRVLVVDDNQVNRKIVRIFLRSYGIEIDEADSGASAVALVCRTRYDIIFMDHMMPEMDGIETVQILRSECGENGSMPIIIALTANAMEGVRETFLENGFQDFLTKPLDRRPLHEALLRWIPAEKRKDAAQAQLPQSVSQEQPERADAAVSDIDRIDIKGIDTAEVGKRYSGSAEEYLELLELYCLDGKRKLTVLQTLWEQKDYKNYGIEVHGLKSASANVGAMGVSKAARAQENAVNQGDTAFVDAHVEQLLKAYENQIESIQQYLEAARGAGHTADAAGRRAIERADLERQILEALNRLENFRSRECAHMVEELLQCQLEADVEAQLRAVQGQLKLYEDALAEELLRELLQRMH